MLIPYQYIQIEPLHERINALKKDKNFLINFIGDLMQSIKSQKNYKLFNSIELKEQIKKNRELLKSFFNIMQSELVSIKINNNYYYINYIYCSEEPNLEEYNLNCNLYNFSVSILNLLQSIEVKLSKLESQSKLNSKNK